MSRGYTFDESVVSDLFQDAHGFRPSGSFWVTWEKASNLRKQIIWDDLGEDLSREVARRARDVSMDYDGFEEISVVSEREQPFRAGIVEI